MSEVSTDSDSVLLLATLKTMRVSRAFRHIAKSAQLELVDIELEPGQVTPEKSAELAIFAQEILTFMKEGHSLLKDIVETGAVAVEENGGGLPLRISPISELPAIGPAAADESEAPHASPVPPVPEPLAAPNAEANNEVQPISVQIGETLFDNEALGVSSDREVELLRLLPHLEGSPITRKRILDLGFYDEGATPSSRTQAYSKAIKTVTNKLAEASGQTIVEKQGSKGGTHYVIKMGMTIDGQEVIPTVEGQPVKKN